MTTSSRHFGTALWVAHFAGDWLPSRYTTRGDTTLLNATLDVDDTYVASLLRIPTEPATYSNFKPATSPAALPVDLWARRRTPIAS